MPLKNGVRATWGESGAGCRAENAVGAPAPEHTFAPLDSAGAPSILSLMILVVGASGQLGVAVVNRLAAAQKPESIRAFVRPSSQTEHLHLPNVELAYGDLRNAASLDTACRGVDVVIATANTVAPRGPYSFDSIEGDGYRMPLDGVRAADGAELLLGIRAEQIKFADNGLPARVHRSNSAA